MTHAYDPAFVFDSLCVSLVKCQQTGKKQPDTKQIADYLIGWLGKEKYDEVMNSREIEDLIRANAEVFALIDILRKKGGSPDAVRIDNSGIKRFRAKQALQKKFFGTELKERKYGAK